MERLILLKYSEIALKGKNRPQFEKKLLCNLKNKLKTALQKIVLRHGRVYLYFEPSQEAWLSEALKEVPGIVSYAKTICCAKDLSQILEQALRMAAEVFRERGPFSFKVAVRRTDKSFPLSSYELACQVGSHLLANCPQIKVDLGKPDWTLYLEIRENAYLYANPEKGIGGLPVGVNGRGLLLLSGGIDSPVAGFMLCKRGLSLDAVYFHTPPFTGAEAQQKVVELTCSLKRFIPDIRLWVINFTDLQLKIKEQGRIEAITLFARACMMQIAELIAKAEGIPVLITGESLGQVASQTPESLRFTESFVQLPVLRPLIGLDKEEIIQKARELGTYEISIRPFTDCCSLFAPTHPLIRPDLYELKEEFLRLDLERLIEEAACKRELVAV